MSLKELFAGGCGVFFVIATLVQIAPIKVNPWTAIARTIGRALNSELSDKLDESLAIAARYRIIRFDDEILFHVHHSEEHFDQILEDIDRYEKFCMDHPKFQNNKAVGAIGNIKKTYRRCKVEHSFLQDTIGAGKKDSDTDDAEEPEESSPSEGI